MLPRLEESGANSGITFFYVWQRWQVTGRPRYTVIYPSLGASGVSGARSEIDLQADLDHLLGRQAKVSGGG